MGWVSGPLQRTVMAAPSLARGGLAAPQEENRTLHWGLPLTLRSQVLSKKMPSFVRR